MAAAGKGPDESYYQVLGVQQSATADEIRMAHCQKVREYGLDRGESPGLARIVESASAVLLDPVRRADYDRLLSGKPQPEESRLAQAEASSSAGIPHPILVVEQVSGFLDITATLRGQANEIGEMIRDGEPGSSPAIVDLSCSAIHQVVSELARRGVIPPKPAAKRSPRFERIRACRLYETWFYPVAGYGNTAVILQCDIKGEDGKGRTWLLGRKAEPAPVIIAVVKTRAADISAFEITRDGVLGPASGLLAVLRESYLPIAAASARKDAHDLLPELESAAPIEAPSILLEGGEMSSEVQEFGGLYTPLGKEDPDD